MEIPDLLLRLEKEAAETGVPILRRAEREILANAAREAAPLRILEIGTAIGFSALLLAKTCPDAEIDTIEIDSVRAERAESVFAEAGVADKLHIHLGDATDIIPTLSASYDFLYLDGPKGQYLRHLQSVEPLLSPRAVICADNVLFRGLVRGENPVPHHYRTIVMRLREYISYVSEHYETKIFEEGDGMAVSRLKPAAGSALAPDASSRYP